MPRGDRDELRDGFALPIFGEEIPVVPKGVAHVAAAEPELPAPPQVPAIRDWSGAYARPDLRRYASYLVMDGRTLDAIAACVTLNGRPVTVAELGALLAERKTEPTPDAVRMAPAAPALAWPSAAARDLAARLRTEIDVPGILGSPRLRDLLRSLDQVLA